MDLTMLHQMSRKAYMDAFLYDGLGDTTLNNLAKILQPANISRNHTPTPLSPIEIAAALKTAPKLAPADYNALLNYLQSTGRQY